MTRYLRPGEIVYIHRQAMLDEGQQSIVIDHEKIEAAAARPQTTVFGDDAYSTLAGKAAALMQSLVVGHPFADGNKRAGLACALVFLRLNGVTSDADQDALYDLTMDVATGRERDVGAIVARIAALFGIESG